MISAEAEIMWRRKRRRRGIGPRVMHESWGNDRGLHGYHGQDDQPTIRVISAIRGVSGSSEQ